MKNHHLYGQFGKPVLRPIESITKEELVDMIQLFDPEVLKTADPEDVNEALDEVKTIGAEAFDFSANLHKVASLITFLLSKGFDLGLLEQGTYTLKHD